MNSGSEIDEKAEQQQDVETPQLTETEGLSGKEVRPQEAQDAETQVGAVASMKALDWESPDDVHNPRNWSLRKKIFHTAIPALCGFVMYFPLTSRFPSVAPS